MLKSPRTGLEKCCGSSLQSQKSAVVNRLFLTWFAGGRGRVGSQTSSEPTTEPLRGDKHTTEKNTLFVVNVCNRNNIIIQLTRNNVCFLEGKLYSMECGLAAK